jgi:hypothetical protein
MGVKQVFKANDDSEHETARAANRHNRLLKAKREFDAAAEKIQDILREGAMTADGVPVSELGMCRRVWRLHPNYCGLPALREFYASPHRMDVDISHSDGVIRISEYDYGTEHMGRRDSQGWVYYPVHQLYADEKKAKEAYIKAVEERLAEFKERLDGLK